MELSLFDFEYRFEDSDPASKCGKWDPGWGCCGPRWRRDRVTVVCVGGVRVTMADSVAKDQPCWLVGGHSFWLTCVLSVDMHTHLQFTPAQSSPLLRTKI